MLRLRNALKSVSIKKSFGVSRAFGAPGHGHVAGPYDAPHGPTIDRTQPFLFGEDPRYHKKEGWEEITYATYALSFILFVWGIYVQGVDPLSVSFLH